MTFFRGRFVWEALRQRCIPGKHRNGNMASGTYKVVFCLMELFRILLVFSRCARFMRKMFLAL